MNRIYFAVLSMVAVHLCGCSYATTAFSLYRDYKKEKRAEEIHDTRMTEEVERNRPRNMPSDEITRTAERLASIIADELPRHPYIHKFIEEHESRLVLVHGEVRNKTEFSPDNDMTGILAGILTRLHNNETFGNYFDVVVDRERAKALMKRSEGESEEVFDDERDGIVQYDSNSICVVELDVFDHDSPGQTTWETHLQVIQPALRIIMIRRDIHSTDI